MRKLISILSLGILLLDVPRVASSMDLTGNLVASGNYAISEDVVVNNNVWFEAHDIQVNDSIKITNFGEIHGGINVCAACTMELQNVGIFENIEFTWTMPEGDLIYQLSGDDECGDGFFKAVLD